MKLGALRQLFYAVRSHKALDCRDKEEDRWKTVEMLKVVEIVTLTIQTDFVKAGGY